MQNKKIKRMATMALLIALVVVLQLLGGILPPIGGFSISLVLIPIVVGAAMYGSGVGCILGGAFGLIVFIGCVTGTDPGGSLVFQASPVLCFLVVMGKGILCGFSAGLVYKLIANSNTANDRFLLQIQDVLKAEADNQQGTDHRLTELCGKLSGVLTERQARKIQNRHYIAMLCAAIICPVVNTGVFVVSMLTLFPDVLSSWANGGDVIAYIFSGLILVNFVPELLINVVFSPAGQRILQTVNKK